MLMIVSNKLVEIEFQNKNEFQECAIKCIEHFDNEIENKIICDLNNNSKNSFDILIYYSKNIIKSRLKSAEKYLKSYDNYLFKIINFNHE